MDVDVNYRRWARITYLALFIAINYGTDLFVQYPPLLWLGIAGLLVVLFDAIICARRRWRVLKAELRSEDDESEPAD